jgi:phage/plasmid primase-like uncharacterized protein
MTEDRYQHQTCPVCSGKFLIQVPGNRWKLCPYCKGDGTILVPYPSDKALTKLLRDIFGGK